MRNYRGEIISGIKQLIKPEYGTGDIDKYGQPVVNWSYLSKYADEEGFDIRNIEKNGKYKIKVKLPYGSILIRYGSELGRFTAPKGTEYEKLALPFVKETVEYNEYKVMSTKVMVVCIVQKGKVAPGFNSDGGAIQYYHPINIYNSVKKGLLERLTV